MKKSKLYFLIAFLPIIVAGPIDLIIHEHDWAAAFKLLISASLAGLTALKALQSTPEDADKHVLSETAISKVP